MSDMHREPPPGLYVPGKAREEVHPFDAAGWVMASLIASGVLGVLVGWWQDDWYLGGACAGSLYALSILTIIAIKD